MTSVINIDVLPEEIRKKVHKYLKELLKLYSDNIVSIFIYGSATGKNYIPGKSDVNMAVILKNLRFSDLKKSLKLVSWGISKKIAAPLMLTIKHMQTSTDVFPVEFLEMKDNYCLLYGQDLLKDLPVEESNIRLQCEQQLKGKLIRIREGYLEIGLRKKGMDALLKESLNSLFPIFRGLLRLRTAQAPPTDKEKIINSLSKNFGTDPTVFLAILRDKKDDNKIDSQDVEPFFEKYVQEIQKLAIASDELKV